MKSSLKQIQSKFCQFNIRLKHMTKNILGMNLYYDPFYAVALENLKKILMSNESTQNIQIEIKYAQFKNFSVGFDERSVQNLPNHTKQTVYYLYKYQYDQFYRSLSLMSKQSILNLNVLGRNTCQLISGFDQEKYHKFYHIRDLLIKMCNYNQGNNYIPRISRGSQLMSIYQELSLNANNHMLRMKQENQIRLDVYIKDEAPQHLRGRYSYSNKSGWIKTSKQPLCQQLDFMLNQRTFRFAINREVDIPVEQQHLQEIAKILGSNPKKTDIRLKRLLRVNKGDISQYALSQIYNINQRNGNIWPDFSSKIIEAPSVLNAYLMKMFINFYSVSEKSKIKFQIESQFTKNKTKHLKRLIQNNNLGEVKYEIQTAIEQLSSFYFFDHATKVRQIPWLNRKSAQLPETRLQNEYGNYMRQEIYQLMKGR